jgi:hypothetical protein
MQLKRLIALTVIAVSFYACKEDYRKKRYYKKNLRKSRKKKILNSDSTSMITLLSEIP